MPGTYDLPKYFNIAGPCVPGEHYMLDAVARLPEAHSLALEKHYFVIHAARQSGKTTLLQALTKQINAQGQFYALYCSLEALQGIAALEDGMTRVLNALRLSLKFTLIPELKSKFRDFPTPVIFGDLCEVLSDLCAALNKPLIIFFDEADCLSGQVLITFLRQLRTGYVNRDSAPFPWSISLIGMRDIRDFKAHIRPDSDTLGSASPFNIVTDALTLVNFTREQVAALYRQHTEATGQIFEPNAAERAWYWSEGQPWLVNALARQVVEKNLARDYTKVVSAVHIDAAAETLIQRRDTHIDSLLERLKEPRVRKVLEPMLFGGDAVIDLLADDTKFCLDLGLVTREKSGALRPSNPIYRDVMVRALNYQTQIALPESLAQRWMDDKALDMSALLREFQQFWRENAEIWAERYEYKEAAPHLILQAFLQRVLNGGAVLDREYALGLGRVDLCVRYAEKNYPVEIKIARPRALAEGLEQMQKYLSRCGAKEGWLVIFDRDPAKPWDDKISWATQTLPDGNIAHVVGC